MDIYSMKQLTHDYTLETSHIDQVFRFSAVNVKEITKLNTDWEQCWLFKESQISKEEDLKKKKILEIFTDI